MSRCLSSFSCLAAKHKIPDHGLTSQQEYLRKGFTRTLCTCCHTEIEVAYQTFYLTQSQYTDTRLTSTRTVCTCCHTEIEVADQTFYLTQSQYTDTRLTSPSADPCHMSIFLYICLYICTCVGVCIYV